MEIYHFNSFYELFCTIYTAYIIADRFKTNYIAVITEHVLFRHNHVKIAFDNANNTIVGFETSFNSITIDPTDKKMINQYPIALNSLKTLKSKTEQSKKEVETVIRDSYQTKSFSYIALYLALYCLVIIILSGVTQAYPNSTIRNIVFIFNLFTFTYLWCAWHHDHLVIPNQDIKKSKRNWLLRLIWGDKTRNLLIQLNKLRKIENGHTFALFYFAIGLILSIAIPVIGYFCGIFGIKSNQILYECFCIILVFFTIGFPIANLIVYFFKASNRAKIIYEDKSLKQRIDSAADLSNSNDYKTVNDFIDYCRLSSLYTVSDESKTDDVITLKKRTKSAKPAKKVGE